MSDIEIIEMNEETSEIKSYPGAILGTVNGHNEPRNPINAINWSFGLKFYHTMIPCFLAFLM
jgi:hypothetical protein